MDRPVFEVELRLLSPDEGGRQSPIRSNYRPTFDLGNAWRGEPMLNDGRIMLANDELGPGTAGVVTVEPLRPEYWDAAQPGTVIPVLEGTRVVGHATVTKRLWPVAFTSKVAAFVRAANEFCTFLHEAHEMSLSERLIAARERLLALYAPGARLPDVHADCDRQAPDYPAPEHWPGFGEHDIYWEVFDPYERDEPVAGSLSDDVLDIYRDLRRGLWFWEKNEMTAAVWEWRFSYESHWGDHAVDALRALHRAGNKRA